MTVRPFARFDESTGTPGALLDPGVVRSYKNLAKTGSEPAVETAVFALRQGTVARTLPKPVICRLCGSTIGSEIRQHGRFEWLAGSEHYVEEHELWPPTLTGLVEAIVPVVEGGWSR